MPPGERESVPVGAQAGDAPARAAWLAHHRPRPWVVALVVFAVTAPLLWAFYARHPLLYDTDSSYHLAVARAMARQGVIHLRDGPDVRMSALTLQGFSDNALLFHVFLAPFAGGDDPQAGGRLALALLDAMLLAAVAALACHAVGWWGLLATLAVAAGSLEVAWRLVRLRPELLALLLLLAALAAAASGRYRWLGALAAAFALAYVAWHAFLGLFVLLFLLRGWVRGRWDWGLALYPVLGTGLGLLVHPAFPVNLLFWKLQSIDFFLWKGSLDVGTETTPNRTDIALLANLGFYAFAAVAWRSSTPGRPSGAVEPNRARDFADAFALAAVVFLGLYLQLARFALYVFPLAALWLLFHIAAHGERIGPRVRLPGRGALPTAVGFALALLIAIPGSRQELARFTRRTSPGPHGERLADRAAFARATPPGAKVAAPWGDTASYLLWAPQGRYLNVLDPVFMAVPFPNRYAAQRAVFDGDEPDVPLVAATALDSDYLAWSQPGAPPRLLARLRGDPRARPLHVGYQALFALAPAPPGSFVLDWRLVPRGTLPPPAGASADRWLAYPRLSDPQARAMEGFVDARRVRAGGCVAFARGEGTGAAGTYELAAAGPVKLWVDEELLIADGGHGAVLGEGVTFRLPAARRLTVLTCPGEGGRNGFYLLRRG